CHIDSHLSSPFAALWFEPRSAPTPEVSVQTRGPGTRFPGFPLRADSAARNRARTGATLDRGSRIVVRLPSRWWTPGSAATLNGHSERHLDSISRVTGFCLRHPVAVAAVWLVAIGLGLAGALRLSPLLTSGFTLPGTDSSRVNAILARDYDDRAG